MKTGWGQPDGQGFVAIRGVALALLLGLAGLMFAAPAEAQSYRFTSVQIEGNQRIEPGTILSYAAVPRGATVTAGELNAAYQRVLNSGLFETVELVPSGNTLVIRVAEFPTINRISIEGNRRLKDEVLLAVVQSQPRRVYSPTLAEQDAGRITQAYEQTGRLAAAVDVKIIRRSNNRVDLVFEIAEGRVVEVERISFVGNRAFSDRRLRRVLQSKQAGLLRTLISSDTYIPDRIEFDKQLLTDFYTSRGHVDFEVLSATSEFSRERNAFFVTFTVREGQSFDFGAISVTSDLPEIDVEPFRRAVTIRPGETYSPVLVEATIARLERLATRQGRTFVRVDPRITRNDRELTLDVEFAIVRGQRIFVERIDIEGNATTLDRVIRTQFDTVEGDPFNPREIRAAAERIRALDYFETAEVEAREGSGPDQVIIDVDVVEKPTGSLGFGATYGVASGLGFNFTFSERNFLGRGQTLAFNVTTGSGTQNYLINFIEPNFLGRDVAFSFTASYSQSSFATNAFYDSSVARLQPALEFPVSEYGRVQVSYIIGGSGVRNVDTGGMFAGDTGSSAILRGEAGLGFEVESGLGYRFSYDNRAGGLDPESGFLLRFGQEVTGLGGSLNYLRTSALVVGERKLRNRDVTLRAVFEGGAINRFGGTPTKITERYFLSPDQLRGFDVRGVGPRDLNVTNMDALGGNYYAVARFEADFPIGLPEEYGVKGGVFLDVGTLWGLDNTLGGPAGTMPVDASAHLRSSVGVSVFWETPIGPLRFNFSKPIAKQSYDIERNFDLTVSTTF